MQFSLICTNTLGKGFPVVTYWKEEHSHPCNKPLNLCSVGKLNKFQDSLGYIFDTIVPWFVLGSLGEEVDRGCLWDEILTCHYCPIHAPPLCKFLAGH